jgi:alcohol dehydrogenase class IV
MFKFKVKTYLHFGAGESASLGKILEESGYKKAGVIVDHGVVNNSQVKKALASLDGKNFSFKTALNSVVEPDYDYLDLFKQQFLNESFDVIVGIGGGSTLDLSKGVATLVTNSGPALQYKGFPKLAHPPLPVVAIPTTAGTGSEVTYNAVFTDTSVMKKLGINSELNYPAIAIIDPEILVECPLSVAVSSGCDALVHTLESYVHRSHTPVSRMYSKEAFRLLFNNLRKLPTHLHDINAQGELALGAYIAGIALMNAGSGPSGAFSYPLGVHYKVPHGYAGAVFLPWITRINVERGYQDYAALYDLINGVAQDLNSDQKNQEFVRLIQKLMEDLGVNQKLLSYQLKPKDIDFMTEQYDVLKAAIDQNPIPITKDDTRRIMEGVFNERKQHARV